MKHALFLLLSSALAASGAELVRGPMVGHVSDTQANFWLKADAQADVGILTGLEIDDLTPVVQAEAVTLKAENGFAGSAAVTGLQAGTRYFYQLTLDGAPVGRPEPVTTAPAAGQPGRLRFAFTSCLGRKAEEPTAGWAYMATKVKADMVLLLGDNHYADSTARGPQTEAYFAHRAVPGFKEVAANTPIYAIWDDHDFGPNDSDGTAKGKEESLATFKAHWANPAYGEPENPGIYYKFTRSGVEFFMLDVRYHRSPDKALQDGTKTMLGARQLEWLKAGLKGSKAKVKVIASGSEWQMNSHGDSWTSFARERGLIFDFIRDEEITGVLLISGDRHFTGGYQVRGELIEITSGPLGTTSYPTKNLPEMFFNHGEKSMFSIFDIDTSAEPNPTIALEVHAAAKGLVERREFSWAQVLGSGELDPLPPSAP
jgi:alkaline phosphatase D